MSDLVIRVGSVGPKGMNNASIQAAVDAVASVGGGKVIVPPGVYKMIDAVHLRSGVHLQGEPGAILRNQPNVDVKIPNHCGYGTYEFVTSEPKKLKVGMGIHLWDNNAFGFYTTVATITKIAGNRIFLNRPLAHDYMGRHGAMASTLHSIIEADGVSDVCIEGLTLDGNASKISRELNGCRGGGILLLRSQRVVIRHVEITGYKGDAIGFQMCADIVVDSCHVHHNVGTGLHPGAGTVRYVIRNNHVHHNGNFGLFYCLRTSHSLCQFNHLHDNGSSGISVGERDTHHQLEGNLIENNDGPAVELRPPGPEGGYTTRWLGNTFRRNCRTSGNAEFIINDGVRDVILHGNTFEPRATEARAVEIKPGAQGVFAVENRVDGKAQTSETFVTPMNRVTDAIEPWETAKPSSRKLPKVRGVARNVKKSLPKSAAPAGPEALSLDGALHLGIERLQPWGDWIKSILPAK